MRERRGPASGSGWLLLVVGEVAVAVAPDAGARGARAELERPHGDREVVGGVLGGAGHAREAAFDELLVDGRPRVAAGLGLGDAVDDADAEARAVGAAGHLGELEAFAPDELVERARAGLAGLVVDGGGADVRCLLSNTGKYSIKPSHLPSF